MAFSGETITDTLAAVIRAEPDWNALPANTPPRIRELLLRCLKKDARHRLQSIGDARIAIDEVVSGASPESLASAEPGSAARWSRALPWAVAAAACIVAALFAFGCVECAPRPRPAIVAEIPPPPKANFVFTGFTAGTPALSPDGQRLVFSVRGPDDRQLLWMLRSPAGHSLLRKMASLCTRWEVQRGPLRLHGSVATEPRSAKRERRGTSPRSASPRWRTAGCWHPPAKRNLDL